MVADSAGQIDKRLKFGSGFGLSFVGGTNIALSPNIIYSLSDKASIGAGVQGSYTSIKDLQSTITYGANAIGQYRPTERLITSLEFVQLNVTTETETPTGENKINYWDSALFVGAGLSITNKIAIGAKYNLLYKEDETVYISPILPFIDITF